MVERYKLLVFVFFFSEFLEFNPINFYDFFFNFNEKYSLKLADENIKLKIPNNSRFQFTIKIRSTSEAILKALKSSEIILKASVEWFVRAQNNTEYSHWHPHSSISFIIIIVVVVVIIIIIIIIPFHHTETFTKIALNWKWSVRWKSTEQKKIHSRTNLSPSDRYLEKWQEKANSRGANFVSSTRISRVMR